MKKPPRFTRTPPTPETRAKISRALRGRPHGEERRRRMSLARRRFLRRRRKESKNELGQ